MVLKLRSVSTALPGIYDFTPEQVPGPKLESKKSPAGLQTLVRAAEPEK